VSERRTTWQRFRRLPIGTQTACALMAIVLVAVLAAVLLIARHDGGSHDRSNRVAVTTTTTTNARVSGGLLRLTIAPASHVGSYERDADFGGFRDVAGCRNVRAVLLIRSSSAPVTYTRRSRCTVKAGRWTDPWSGVATSDAHDLQIDHTVPLANAWRSGAWAWTQAQRVAFANDLADPGHLLPILAGENESKGDGGPEAWKPPNTGAWCRYATTWSRIKAKWHLTATAPEWAALEAMAATC